MPKPVIWTVDDDPDVLRAVERDLRRQYGDRYKVISADSGASALEAVKLLKLQFTTSFFLPGASPLAKLLICLLNAKPLMKTQALLQKRASTQRIQKRRSNLWLKVCDIEVCNVDVPVCKSILM